jgi:beta-lactamase superfamily II metal-dependent hydrolase
MPEMLAVTFIDVGWGDCILIESETLSGDRRYGLIDCNDTINQRSGLLFVKRYLERNGRRDWKDLKPNFEWVLLTHGHADHARGLKTMMSTFGTKNFWYPKSVASTTHGSLIKFANRATKSVQNHQAIDSTKLLNSLIDFDPVEIDVLWPDDGEIDESNENNNSVVLVLTLGAVSFVLTGDAEANNWDILVNRLPDPVNVFQVPHHGGRNGVFDDADNTPWLNHLNSDDTAIAMSSHIVPHDHPHVDVVDALNGANFNTRRTDRNYHLRFSTDGVTVSPGWWR